MTIEHRIEKIEYRIEKIEQSNKQLKDILEEFKRFLNVILYNELRYFDS